MQGMLEKLFGGTAAGLIGFGLMIVLFMPKVIKWYKSRHEQKKDSTKTHPRGYGGRWIRRDNLSEGRTGGVADHPEFGEPVDCLGADRKAIWLQTAAWTAPFILALIIMYLGVRGLGAILLIFGVISLCIGLNGLFHLGDRVFFYRTGMTVRVSNNRYSVDYNAIEEYHVRKALFPWMAPTYLIHLGDGRLIVLDGTCLERGQGRPGELLGALSERIV